MQDEACPSTLLKRKKLPSGHWPSFPVRIASASAAICYEVTSNTTLPRTLSQDPCTAVAESFAISTTPIALQNVMRQFTLELPSLPSDRMFSWQGSPALDQCTTWPLPGNTQLYLLARILDRPIEIYTGASLAPNKGIVFPTKIYGRLEVELEGTRTPQTSQPVRLRLDGTSYTALFTTQIATENSVTVRPQDKAPWKWCTFCWARSTHDRRQCPAICPIERNVPLPSTYASDTARLKTLQTSTPHQTSPLTETPATQTPTKQKKTRRKPGPNKKQKTDT
jgi:hypothetical protein